jgi:hypothetical protein
MSDERPDVTEQPQDDVLRCSFCGKDQFQLRKLVEGPHALICADCVEECADIISDDRGEVSGEDAPGRIVGSVATARCSLCRTPARAADLVTVDTRGAVCDTCLTVLASVVRERKPETSR